MSASPPRPPVTATSSGPFPPPGQLPRISQRTPSTHSQIPSSGITQLYPSLPPSRHAFPGQPPTGHAQGGAPRTVQNASSTQQQSPTTGHTPMTWRPPSRGHSSGGQHQQYSQQQQPAPQSNSVDTSPSNASASDGQPANGRSAPSVNSGDAASLENQDLGRRPSDAASKGKGREMDVDGPSSAEGTGTGGGKPSSPSASAPESASASPPANGASSKKKTTAQQGKEKDGKDGKKAKRRKVNLACIYCRRSHMTCNEGRPCQRCIKRDIGHLCHDEASPRSHPHGGASSSASANAAATRPGITMPPSGGVAPGATQPMGIGAPGLQSVTGGPNLSAGNLQGLGGLAAMSGAGGGVSTASSGSIAPSSLVTSAPLDSAAVADGTSSPAAAGALHMNGIGLQNGTGAPASGGTEATSGNSAFGGSGAQLGANLGGLNDRSVGAAGSAAGGTGRMSGRDPSNAFAGAPQPLVSPSIGAGIASSLAGWPGFGSNGPQTPGSGGGSRLGQAGGNLSSMGGPPSSTLGGVDGVGGWGNLLFGPEGAGNEFSVLSDFLETLDSSSFLNPASFGPSTASTGTSSAGVTVSVSAPKAPESLPTVSNGSVEQAQAGARGGAAGGPREAQAHVSGAPPSDSEARGGLMQPFSQAQQLSTSAPGAAAGPEAGQPSASVSAPASASAEQQGPITPAPVSTGTSTAAAPAATSGPAAQPLPPNLAGATKTEQFLLTAADQKDGTRDERLARVIRAKYEAGLLRPYNYVNGYARLSKWMERNVSPTSRQRILKPISVFRPAFRAIAQSLTDLDLVFIEEAFERLLLDYDRVFSTMGIPACLWRRTGEIYKGNKEFAELVGVGWESLREGKLCIYELMAEESAVNYWEKYGAIAFDPGQKAVLTSCVLKHNYRTSNTSGGGSGAANTAWSNNPVTASRSQQGRVGGGGGRETNGVTGFGGGQRGGEDGLLSCCFSFTIRRDAWNIPTMIVGNFLPFNPS